MTAARTYFLLVGAAYRAELQYRGNLFLMIVGGIAYQGVGLAFIGAVLHRFGTIGGWGLAEITFLYALRLTSHALWLIPFGQLTASDLVVREGEFDRYLVRPANPLLQLLTRRVQLNAFGDLLGGVVLLAVTAVLAPVDWSPLAVAYLLLALVGGALVEVSCQLAISAGTFRLLTTNGFRNAVNNVFNTVGNYPMQIFSSGVRFGLTFVLPLAFVAYLPATVLLGRTGELSVPAWFAYAAPAVGVVLFTAAYQLWMRQTRHYTSSGH